MYEKMGYFNNWKFGVPIELVRDGRDQSPDENIRLINEDSESFIVIFAARGKCHATPRRLRKSEYSYVPIDHTIDVYDSPIKHRFPVCSNGLATAYCNKSRRIARMAIEPTDNVREIT